MLILILRTIISVLRSHRALALEKLALRHQLDVMQRNTKRPRLTNRDRTLWVILSQFWPDWRKSLMVVQPDTVIHWHRKGFKLYWRWKSRPRRMGRRRVPEKVRDLIRRMSRANPLWGAPRIHGKLLKLGITVHQATVSKYMVRHDKPPSQSWRSFLKNHAKEIVSVDFFTVPTVIFRVLFVFLVLSNERRQIQRVLKEYFHYYHESRTHLGLEKDCPNTRPVQPPESGPISSEPMVGGLHHRYFRQAA